MFAEGLELEAGVGGRCSRDDERCARRRRCAEPLSAVLKAKSRNSCDAERAATPSRSSNGAKMKSIINALKKEGKPERLLLNFSHRVRRSARGKLA